MVNFSKALITIKLDELRSWEPPTELPEFLTYLVGQMELTSILHWQLLAIASKPLSTRQWKSSLGCNWAHLEPVRGTIQEAIAYVTKEETRYVDLRPLPNNVNLGSTNATNITGVKRDYTGETYSQALAAENYESALEIIRERSPRDYVIFNSQITSSLRAHFVKQWTPVRELHFTLPQQDRQLLTEKAIVITGDSGLGKTQYALSHFENPLIVRHIDALKRLRNSNDGIVFDDMNFNHWAPTSCIHLVDMELPSEINVKHSTAIIPAKTPRIFTTNRIFIELFSEKCNESELEAIRRRCHIVNIHNVIF